MQVQAQFGLLTLFYMNAECNYLSSFPFYACYAQEHTKPLQS